MFFKVFFLVFLVGVYLENSYQLSTPADPSYNAGVVEFPPSTINTAKERVKDSLQRMKSIIESNEARALDILVFPEAVINDIEWMTYVPDPEQKIAPCDIPDYDNFLNELSCASRSSRLYLVINIVEKEDCAVPGYKDSCDPTGLNKYNTNVVFDREGRVISRYRKTHLYRNEWYRFNVRSMPEVSVFQTDFGVTFGHFICFDMLFYEPAQLLLRDHNISDIVYPTMWFSELPFLTAIQLQESWAFAHDINLLAAGASTPSKGNTGSGIYAGRFGRLNTVFYEESNTFLLTARVPKRDRISENQLPPTIVPQFVPQLETRRLSKITLIRDYNLDVFKTKLLDAEFTSVNETLCHDQFCCDFSMRRQPISSSPMYSSYRYRLVAYDGHQTTHQRIEPSEIAVCAIVACTNEELYSCGHIFPESVLVGNKYYFNSITVHGDFRNTARRSILPSTVDGIFMPLPVSMYSWDEQEKASVTNVTLSLKSPKSDLLTFGIWSNYYSTAVSKHNLDRPSLNRSGSGSLALSMLSVVFVLSGFVMKFLMS